MTPPAVPPNSPATSPRLSPAGSKRFPLKPGALAILLAGLVALLRILLSRPLSFCGTPDACYYLGMAQTLASGRGFHARFLYDFQQAHPTLPNTGVEYWRPGISLILLLLKPLGGVTLHGSIALTTLVGVLYAAAAWHVAIRTYGNRRIALAGFGLCLLSSPAWVGSATPDSGLYYGAAVAWFLALFTVRRQGLLQDILALVCVGLAYLIRNDAALLLVPLLAVLWRRSHPSPAPDGDRPTASPIANSPAYTGMMLLGFLLALAPMHLLYRAVLGTAFPSGTAQVLFLNDLGDFGRYHDPATLHSLLRHGIGHLLAFRITTLLTVLYRIPVLMIGYPALVFLPGLFLRPSTFKTSDSTTSDPNQPGWPILSQNETVEARETQTNESGSPKPGWPILSQSESVRSDEAQTTPPFTALPELTGPVTFGLTALLVYTLILPAIGGFSALRTAVGLMPLVSVLVIVAVLRAARTPQLAAWIAAAVISVNALSGLMELRRDLPLAELIGAADRDEAQHLIALDADPATAVVLTNDPVQFSVTTGFATVALPSNGLDAIAQAAHDFHATHVILDSNNLPASPADLTRQLHPVRSVTLQPEHTLILELPSSGALP